MAGLLRSSYSALSEEEGAYEETKPASEPSSKWSREWQSEVGGQQVSLWMRQSKDEVRWEVASEASAARFAAVLDHAGLVAADMDPRMDVEELVHLMVSLCEEGRIAVTDAHSGCVVRLSHAVRGSKKVFEYAFDLEMQEWSEKDERLWELSKENARLKEENERLKKDWDKSVKEKDSLIDSLTRQLRSKEEETAEQEKTIERLSEELKQKQQRINDLEEVIERLTRDLGEEVRKREEAQKGYDELLKRNEEDSAALKAEREKSARLTRDLGEEVRKREELVRSTVEPKKKPRVSDQYSREYVRQMAEREGLSMMEDSKIDGLIAAKMREWEGIAERDGGGRPVFILKMEEYADKSKDPWHAIQAQYLYLNRRDVRADEEYIYGRNALHICAKYPSLSPMMQWLLEDGNIDPNKGNGLEQSPLHYAAVYDSIECASLLLNDERVDKDAKDEDGNTPLIYAAKYNRPAIVSLLLQHGCNKDIWNEEGKTALMIAEEKGHTKVIKLLKDTDSTPKKGFLGWF